MSWKAAAWPFAALLAAGVARRWLDVVEVRGLSMVPTLLPGDRLVVGRMPPRAGDVVLALDPRDSTRELIKRVTAIDGVGATLIGDNPAASTDARSFGAIPPSIVTWRVLFRYWPLDRAGRIAAAPPVRDEGGEAACAFPEALIAG